MPVIKEFRCVAKKCGREFESLVPVCPRCGSREVRRVFLTPPGINGGYKTKGSARAIDRLLEREFSKQNIANFSNCSGENKVSYARRVRQYGAGVYGTPKFGLTQPPVKAFCGAPGDFSAAARDPLGYGLTREALPELPFSGLGPTDLEHVPTVDQGGVGDAIDMVALARSTALPESLAKRTQRVRR